MNRIAVPTTVADATVSDAAASQASLRAVERQLGLVPNLFRLIANSPAALDGYLALSGALSRGELPAPIRERIALAVAELNGCGYCLAAHSYIGAHMAKLDPAEILANRRGRSLDREADAAVRFAASVAQTRGHVSDDAVAAVKRAGYSDAQVVEIVLHVAMNVLTNYVNEVAMTAVDFPAAEALVA